MAINGIYLIKNFEIIGREKFNGKEEIDEEKTKSITNFIIDLHKKLDEARKELTINKLKNNVSNN